MAARTTNQPTRGLSTRTLEHASETLRVLAHPLRLKLLERLRREPMSVSALAAQVRQPHHLVSQHLNHLRRYGIVARQRHGREVHYRLHDTHAAAILDWIHRRQFDDTLFQGGEAI
ncbi:MAG: ArsR/SmtB family transcription factor [Phycisphaeraceae bacterium]